MKSLNCLMLLMFSCLVVSETSAQEFIGPSIGFSVNTLADRPYIRDNSITASNPEFAFGVLGLREVSPFVSYLAAASYSFQEFSVLSGNDRRDLKLQLLNLAPGVRFSMFDESTSVIRPYFDVIAGFSLKFSQRIVDAADRSYPSPTGIRFFVGIGPGITYKISEFSRINLGVDFTRSLTEVFKGSDARMNSFNIKTGVCFML